MGYPGSHKGTFVVTSSTIAATPPNGSSFSKISVSVAGNVTVKGNNLFVFVTDKYVEQDPNTEVIIAMKANQTIEGEFTSVRGSSILGIVAYI